MDYLVRGDGGSLRKLLPLVIEICSERRVKIGKVALALIAQEIVKRAQNEGLMMEINTANVAEFLLKLEGGGDGEG